MNWPDERYVKVYTRDTLTWRAWSWQARTVFLHLTRKLDGAGLIEVGKMNPVDALALQLDLPREVVAEGLPQILDAGTAELVPAALLVPNWVDAQEARKTEATKKRDQRERARDQRRASEVAEIRQADVPQCPAVSPDVPLQPSPAQPSSAQGSAAAKKPRRAPKPPADSKPPPDPRHAPLVSALCEAFFDTKGSAYAFTSRDGKAVQDLLALAEPDEVVARWRRALPRKLYPIVSSLPELVTHFNAFTSTEPPPAKRETCSLCLEAATGASFGVRLCAEHWGALQNAMPSNLDDPGEWVHAWATQHQQPQGAQAGAA